MEKDGELEMFEEELQMAVLGNMMPEPEEPPEVKREEEGR